uniref:Uncharacterized protein n=1 Tax=Glossina austeni TaxID=7395 RepID=A0A1A9VTH2_GLOAU
MYYKPFKSKEQKNSVANYLLLSSEKEPNQIGILSENLNQMTIIGFVSFCRQRNKVNKNETMDGLELHNKSSNNKNKISDSSSKKTFVTFRREMIVKEGHKDFFKLILLHRAADLTKVFFPPTNHLQHELILPRSCIENIDDNVVCMWLRDTYKDYQRND